VSLVYWTSTGFVSKNMITEHQRIRPEHEETDGAVKHPEGKANEIIGLWGLEFGGGWRMNGKTSHCVFLRLGRVAQMGTSGYLTSSNRKAKVT
jgi:hypothetical protein